MQLSCVCVAIQSCKQNLAFPVVQTADAEQALTSTELLLSKLILEFSEDRGAVYADSGLAPALPLLLVHV